MQALLREPWCQYRKSDLRDSLSLYYIIVIESIVTTCTLS